MENNNNVGWIEIIGGVALGFLTGLLLDTYENKKTNPGELGVRHLQNASKLNPGFCL